VRKATPCSLAEGLHCCESPIEREMHLALAHAAVAAGMDDGLYIYPQCHVGKYRVDFLVQCRRGDEALAEVVVECDGHDFHERTKAQASRDKKRDRDLQADGITVLRFTGADIWRDPFSCADEVFEHVRRVVDSVVMQGAA
jgi:very-short-patch-repair endonuclease